MSTDAKTVQIQNPDTLEWNTLPGNTADISFERNQLNDTIFGERVTSTEAGLGAWTLSSNAIYKGVAGYNSVIKRTGTSTSFTTETMGQVDGQRYRINDLTRSVWDWNEEVTIFDDGLEVDAEDIAEIIHITGTVVFDSGYTVDGPVTATGSYLPTAAFGRASAFDLSQTADSTGTTAFEDAAGNNGWAMNRSTLLDADLELTAFYRNDSEFYTILNDRDVFVVEIDLDGTGLSVARGIYKVVDYGTGGDVGGDEEEGVQFGLSVPIDVRPFDWIHQAGTSMPAALRTVQNAWWDRVPANMRYLAQGPNNRGWEGEGVVTDASISSSVDGLIEANIELLGTSNATEINT